jgi:hypothetical protein
VVRPHWYFITTFHCVLGGCTTVYRERRYTPRPEKWEDRHAWREHACYTCQYGMFL